MKLKHPMQPIGWAKDRVIRFKANKIIEWLFQTGKLDLNEIACNRFPVEDQVQLAQLLGYSVSGFGDLSYVPKKLVAECNDIADKLAKRRPRSRVGKS